MPPLTVGRTTFINRFYHPDELATAQLLGDLAERLAAAGHEIQVVTGCPPGAAREERRAGVLVCRVGPPTRATPSLIGRSFDFLVFWNACAWHLLRSTRPGDTLVPLTDPPLLGVIVAAVARLRGARLIHWVQDIYPEVAQQLAPRTGVRNLLAATIPARNWAWRQASVCVTLGGDMARLMQQSGVAADRLRQIPNWPPAGIQVRDGQAIRQERGLEGKFVVAYSGNLGRVHQLEAIAPVVAALRDHPEIVFTFTGTGARRAALEAALTAQDAPARFFPPEPRTRLSEGLAMGDVHWVTLRPGLESVVFPSKLAGVLAAGKPVIFLGNPECGIARIVREAGVGHVFAPEATDEIVACIRRLAANPGEVRAMGQRAAAWASDHATLDEAASRWADLLQPSTPGLLKPARPSILPSPHVGT